MILVGPMQLHQPQPLDPMEPFFTGTQTDGGYWLDASRLSAHNHSGGLNGNAVAAVIPPGSITAGQLDPAVLAPYALTDGSKPFSGQVTMQADAVIRDELLFGEQGTALAPDVHLRRTGVGALRLDTTLGVGVAPAAWYPAFLVVQVGASGALLGDGSDYVALSRNNYQDAAGTNRALRTATGGKLYFDANGVVVQTAPSVAAGAAQTFTTRASIAPTGTLTLAPDAGAAAVVGPGGDHFRINAGAGLGILFTAGAGIVGPATDNAVNSGGASNRWASVYAVAGTINTSAAEAKTDITPLDPADALAAVLATDPVTFTYTAPAPTAEQYELPDDPEQAEQVLHQRLVDGPLMEAARSQAGFVLDDPTGTYHTDPLLEIGPGQSAAAHTAGVLLGAVHELARRLEVLEGA